MTSADVPMVVQLPEHGRCVSIVLTKPLDPRSWRTVPKNKKEDARDGGHAILELVGGFPPADQRKPVFIQFQMDNLGRHKYLSVSELAESFHTSGEVYPVVVRSEDEVKQLREDRDVIVLTAHALSPSGTGDSMGVAAPDTDDAILCPPMSLQANYSVVHDLTLGRTQRVILVDESTLARGGPHMPPIFNHLTLIVNCHQDASANRPGKYRTGSAEPKVHFQPVHKLYGEIPNTIVTRLTDIVVRMWDELQRGSVAVHCLAGLHRAPAVVACFYLYRYYALGHRQLPHNIDEIYGRMRAVRPSVAPLGYIELIKLFQRHMISKHGGTP